LRFVSNLADRLLGAVAPRVTAGACVPPDQWKQSCGCVSHIIRYKNCHYSCNGTPVCGSCFNSDISC